MIYSTDPAKPVQKAPFYYIAHPHEAYTSGYNPHLGTAVDGDEKYGGYNYYLPIEVVKIVPVLNTYIHTLITHRPIHPERQRRKSYYSSIDTAVSLLHRIAYHNKMGNTFAMGSKHLSPMTWSVVGPGEPPTRMCRNHWFTVYSLIDHYTRRYESPCHCHPVCLYQGGRGRDSMNSLMVNSPRARLTPNVLVAAALSFARDVLEHVGPDTCEFFDLFTNDLRVDPASVDLDAWKHARDKALYPHGAAQTAVTTRRPEPGLAAVKKVKVTVRITDEGDDLSAGAKTTLFRDIERKAAEQDYFENYCHM